MRHNPHMARARRSNESTKRKIPTCTRGATAWMCHRSCHPKECLREYRQLREYHQEKDCHREARGKKRYCQITTRILEGLGMRNKRVWLTIRLLIPQRVNLILIRLDNRHHHFTNKNNSRKNSSKQKKILPLNSDLQATTHHHSFQKKSQPPSKKPLKVVLLPKVLQNPHKKPQTSLKPTPIKSSLAETFTSNKSAMRSLYPNPPSSRLFQTTKTQSSRTSATA